MISAFMPVELMIGVIIFWLAIALLGLAVKRRFYLVSQILFPLGAAAGVVMAFAGFLALGDQPGTLVLPLGLPDLPFHLRLDALSAFFLIILGSVSAAISVFSAGYFRAGEGASPGLLCLRYHVFLASMALVLLADDAYLFMMAWETMALSSYFLVTTQHRIAEIRSAGFLYLLIAHVGAVGILLSFGVLQGGGGDYTFAAMRAAQPTEFLASAAFLLALFGFGAKAGLLPLHIWLPEAHPAAPSPVSALMSGVMLKTAIYGLIRLTFDLLHAQMWWWGVLVLALGLITALFGVMFAAVQDDMKRLLAYSSIENIGLILAGIGLAMIFRFYNMPTLAALALIASLYHCINHAYFKSLLFLATGHVLHATKERNLGKLGGLIHTMPWVAGLSLVGVLAIASLPPLNGFASEWLLLQAFLFSPGLPNPYLAMLVPISAAAVALAAALAAYVMVKFYGVIFLGQPREEKLAQARDAGIWERIGLAWLALGCLLLGIMPGYVISQLDHVALMSVGETLGQTATQHGWLFLTPVTQDRASYSPAIILAVVAVAVLLTILLAKMVYRGKLRRAPAWDCGYPLQTPRMQDTATGFGQPIRQMFELFFRIERDVPSPFDREPRYHGKTEDQFWYWLYLPVARLTERISSWIGILQHGRIHLYLLYSFVTLLALLMFVHRG